ncbi:hypothetical protein Tco_1279108, partial [Tanacetum coccineum]
MADAEHAPTMAPPIRTDEQILPCIRWVPIGKSNCYLNEENLNPAQFSRLLWTFLIKQISSELLQRHQQYRLSIFNNSGILSVLTVKLGVISVNWTSNGYPREVINLLNVTTNDMFQPWRALATILNLCLTGK